MLGGKSWRVVDISKADVVLKQPEAILQAIESHDAKRAEAAMSKHLESVKEQLTALFAEKRI